MARELVARAPESPWARQELSLRFGGRWTLSELDPSNGQLFVRSMGEGYPLYDCAWTCQPLGRSFDEFPDPVHRRQSRSERQGVNPSPVGVYERVADNIQRLCATFKRLEGSRDILGSADFHCDNLEAERESRYVKLAQFQYGAGISDVGHGRQPAETRDDFPQQFESLACTIGKLEGKACNVAARSR